MYYNILYYTMPEVPPQLRRVLPRSHRGPSALKGTLKQNHADINNC